MKRSMASVLIILCFLAYCRPSRSKVEKATENGVEVIINHKEPYVLEDVPAVAELKKKILIDFESQLITDLGIADIRGFDVDSKGNIYISVFKGDYCIYKFDKSGAFADSFIRKGQGPKEAIIIKSLNINTKDDIYAYNVSQLKLMVLDTQGGLINEHTLPLRFSRISPLLNGIYLISKNAPERPSLFYFFLNLGIYDADFKEKKIIDDLKVINGRDATYWSNEKEKIYVGSEEIGYEIRVYDLEGNLNLIVKKKYDPVPVPENIRKQRKILFEESMQTLGTSEDIPKLINWPPFEAFFVDYTGRIYVRTFENGEVEGSRIHDVFTPEGVFISRISLELSFDREYKYALLRNKKIYGFKEKGNGFEQFISYRITWK